MASSALPKTDRSQWSSIEDFSVAAVQVGPWHVSIYDDWRPLEPVWRALQAEGRLTAFQRYEWASRWYAAMEAADRSEALVVVVGRNGDPAPVMLWPLCRTVEDGLRVIEFAGRDLSDYRAPIVASEDRLDDRAAVEASQAVLDVLDCDLVRFSGIGPTVGGRGNPLSAFTPSGGSMLGAHAVRFTDGAVPIASGFRRDLDRLVRKLERERGTPRFIVSRSAAEAKMLFAAMMEMRASRFEALGRPDALEDDAARGFYRSVFTDGDAGRFGTMVGLEVGGEIVAADACLRHGDEILVLAGSFRMDGDWHKYGLGNLLTRFELEHALAEGCTGVDLTLGDEPYKARFGAERTELGEYHSARSLGALPSWVGWQAKTAIRRSPQLLRVARSLRQMIQRSAIALASVELFPVVQMLEGIA